MSNNFDGNLLFGLFAIQNGFITHLQFLAAVRAWIREKDTTLAELLVRLGALSKSQRNLLEPIVEEHICRHNNDAQLSLQSISSIEDIRKELLRLCDPEIDASIQFLPNRHRANDLSAVAPSTDSNVNSSRFHIIRPHRKGGLGEVFVAKDTELGREVALKEIQSQYADDRKSIERFTREAKITGGLEHPGIVPVYGLGAYADGRPFYAMRFIRGNNLHEAINAFHAKLNSTYANNRQFEYSLELRRLLQRLIDVCESIHYAHSHGVLHRDLKPGNIMLGRYGETLVVDWGLAKHISSAFELPMKTDEVPSLKMEPITISTEETNQETQLGEIMGTPGYMSPEQALGRIDLLSPASDVFSLGATLYEIITGKRPYSGDRKVAIHLAQEARFASPRMLNPRIPKPLEAICLRAMSAKIVARYPSAQALAEDIEKYLADEPTIAFREPIWVKVERWRRKHYQWLTAATCIFIVSITASWLVLLYYQQAQSAKLASLEATQKERLAREGAKLIETASTYLSMLRAIRDHKDRLHPGWTTKALLDLKKAAEQPTKLRNFVDLRTTAAMILTEPDVKEDPDWPPLTKDRLRLAPVELAYSPSGKLLAIGLAGDNLNQNPTIVIIDSETGRTQNVLAAPEAVLPWIPLGLNKNGITSVRFGNSDDVLFAGTRNGKLYRWSLAGADLDPISASASSGGVFVNITNDGKYVITNTGRPAEQNKPRELWDRQIRCWDATTLKQVSESRKFSPSEWPDAFDVPISSVAISADDKYLVAQNEGRGSGIQLSIPSLEIERVYPFGNKMAFHPGGQRLAAAVGEGLRFYSTQDLTYECSLQPKNSSLRVQFMDFPQFANKGEILACLNKTTNSVCLWRPSSFMPWANINHSAGETIANFTISRDGRRIALCSESMVCQYSIMSRSLIHHVIPFSAKINGFGLDANGALIATTLRSRLQIVGDQESESTANISSNMELFTDFDPSYSPNGRWFVAAGKRNNFDLEIVVLDLSNVLPSRKIFIDRDEESKFIPAKLINWSWSKEGYLLAAMSSRIYGWDLTDTNPKALHKATSDFFPAILESSLRGDYVAFEIKEGLGFALGEVNGISKRSPLYRVSVDKNGIFIEFIANLPTKNATAACGLYSDPSMETDRRIAVGCESGMVALIDLMNGDLITENSLVHKDKVTSLTWCGNGRLVSVSRDGVIAVWHASKNDLTLLYTIKTLVGISKVASSSDGRSIYLLQDNDDCIDVYNLGELDSSFSGLGISATK